MKKLVFLLAVIGTFAFDLPDKSTCTAPVVPVCFSPVEPGTTRCSMHRIPLSCLCNATVLDGGMERACMRPCVAGAGLCPTHYRPPLTDSIPK